MRHIRKWAHWFVAPAIWFERAVNPPVLPDECGVRDDDGGQAAWLSFGRMGTVMQADVQITAVDWDEPRRPGPATALTEARRLIGPRSTLAIPGRLDVVWMSKDSPPRFLVAGERGTESNVLNLPEGDFYFRVVVTIHAGGPARKRSARLRLHTGSIENHHSAQIHIDREGQPVILTTLWPGGFWVLLGGAILVISAASAWHASDSTRALARIGLVLDIGGIWFLAFSALGKQALHWSGARLGGGGRLPEASPAQRERDRETLRARVGVLLAVTGFVFQFAAQFP